jgi:hypothetical protein
MALPTTGPISLGQVKEELNKTGSISLGSTDVRNLAGKTSGQISLSDLYGKSNTKEVNVQLFQSNDIYTWKKISINYNIVSGKLIIKTTDSDVGIVFKTDYNGNKRYVQRWYTTVEENIPSGTGHWVEFMSNSDSKSARGEIWFQGTVIA